MSLNHYSFSGFLTRPPFKDAIIPARSISMQLESWSDYEVVVAERKLSDQAVVISFQEHYILLTIITEEFFSRVGEIERALLKAHFPTWAKLTPPLLHKRVLISHGLDYELRDLLKRGVSVLTVSDTFFRHPQEMGENSIDINLFVKNDFEKEFTEMIEFLKTFGIQKHRA